MHPYDVLNLPKNATIEEIKSRYKELARENHPDKLHGCEEEEKRRREEYFKQVTVAYQVIMDSLKKDEWNHDRQDTHDTDYWKQIWAEVEKRDIWSFMNNIFKDVATKYIHKKRHEIRLDVTLEDVVCAREKKLRLFLQGVVEPVFTTLNCKEYPVFTFTYISQDNTSHIVTVNLVLAEHKQYDTDDEGNLYYDGMITLQEYIRGVNLQIPYLDGSKMEVHIEPFVNLEEPIVIEGKGILNGDLHIHVRIAPIAKQKWSLLHENDQSMFLGVLEVLNKI
jgi:DnaJ-class molecular chaperone